MPTHIAFLRGINVGGHRVKMDHLRALFDEMGFHDVSTFIASGNVVFQTGLDEPSEIRGMIEERLAEALGYEVDTFLRTPERLAQIVPAEETGPGITHYVLFLHGPAPADLRAALADLESDADRFAFDGHEVHWRIRGKMSESPLFGGALDRALRGVPNTMRGMNTLRRIVAKTPGGPS